MSSQGREIRRKAKAKFSASSLKSCQNFSSAIIVCEDLFSGSADLCTRALAELRERTAGFAEVVQTDVLHTGHKEIDIQYD